LSRRHVIGLVTLLLVATGLPATAQESMDAAVLEAVCREKAPDDATRETCLEIVRTVLAPDGSVALPAGPEPREPAVGTGMGATQETATLRVTLADLRWGHEEEFADQTGGHEWVIALVEFESTDPEAYVAPYGFTAVDPDGFAHPTTFVTCPEPGCLDTVQLGEGRRAKGWIGFEVPEDAERLEIEYDDWITGDRPVWTVER
jgi:hypothetical protein